jgi:hypothetical protein
MGVTPIGAEAKTGGAESDSRPGASVAELSAPFFAKIRQGQQKPERGVFAWPYIGLMRMYSEERRHKALFRSNPATLIVSAIWGINPGPVNGGSRKRKEMAGLYAAYASFLIR